MNLVDGTEPAINNPALVEAIGEDFDFASDAGFHRSAQSVVRDEPLNAGDVFVPLVRIFTDDGVPMVFRLNRISMGLAIGS